MTVSLCQGILGEYLNYSLTCPGPWARAYFLTGMGRKYAATAGDTLGRGSSGTGRQRQRLMGSQRDEEEADKMAEEFWPPGSKWAGRGDCYGIAGSSQGVPG